MRSITSLRRCLGIVVFITLILAGVPPRSLSAGPLYQAPDRHRRRYFEETGFSVTGDFLNYFERHGGLEIFGYPISSSYLNDDGVYVQYFQKARMGWHPLNRDPYKVQLGLLGDELGFRQPQAGPPTAYSARKVYFEVTGHTVAYMFLDYFRDHGGIGIFGYPITEMFIENQKIVQYFQRLKLVWDVQTSEITVGNLGEVYVAANRDRIPANVLEPPDLRIGEQGIQNLRLVMDLAYAVVSSRLSQDVSVVVLDEWAQDPVTDAQVTLFLEEDDGMARSASPQILRTDSLGRVKHSFPLEDITPGTWIIVRADVAYGGIEASQKEIFLVWW